MYKHILPLGHHQADLTQYKNNDRWNRNICRCSQCSRYCSLIEIVSDGVNVLLVNLDNTAGYQTVRLKLFLKQSSNDIPHSTMGFKYFALAFSFMTPYILVVASISQYLCFEADNSKILWSVESYMVSCLQGHRLIPWTWNL